MDNFRARIVSITGPYTNTAKNSSAFGRKILYIKYIDGTRRMVSYPKFLVECLLDRELDRNTETIDHIDNNFENNNWDNLRIINRNDHCSQDSKQVLLVEGVCIWCNKPVTRKASQTRALNKRGIAGPFCNRTCSGKYGAAVGYGKIEKLAPQKGFASVPQQKEKEGGILVASLPQAQSTTELNILCWIEHVKVENKEKATEKSRHIKETRKERTHVKYVQQKQKESPTYVPQEYRPRRSGGADNRPDCLNCGKPVKDSKTKYCSYACSHFVARKVEHPTKEELQKLVWELPTVHLAKRFGVSDKAIDKWCKTAGIKKPPRGYWAKKYAEAQKSR